MKTVVFLGPSLDLVQARAILPDAIYLPPAKQADLLSAVGIHRPQLIGLVDGEFGQSVSVWHKEILFALDKGIAVYGASSMGALRGAETSAFGMQGVGRIYEMYARGELTDDDEVALVHGLGEAGYRNLSEPMVNLRATFRKARDAGLLDDTTHQRLVAVAKALFFPDRTFPRIFQDAERVGIPPATVAAVRDFARQHYVDLKGEDAREMLGVLREVSRAGVVPERKPFVFNRTPLFQALYDRDRKVRHDDFDVPLVCIANWAALHAPSFGELNFHALNRGLAQLLAELLEVRVEDADIEAEHQRFRQSRALTGDGAFEQWLRGHDLEAEEFRELMTQLAVCRRLHRWLVSTRVIEGTTRLVLDELRLSGAYQASAHAAAQQERILEEQFPRFKESGFGEASLHDLVIEHLGATQCDMHVHYKQWSEEAGFPTLIDLRVELLRARLGREYLDQVADSLATLMEGDATAAAADDTRD